MARDKDNNVPLNSWNIKLQLRKELVCIEKGHRVSFSSFITASEAYNLSCFGFQFIIEVSFYIFLEVLNHASSVFFWYVQEFHKKGEKGKFQKETEENS